jgi:hypothetical protein
VFNNKVSLKLISILSFCFSFLSICPAIANTLVPGRELSPGETILSNNRQYTLILQHDGNLVLYRSGGGPLWATWTQGKPVTKAVMQTDGNFVLYDNLNRAVWASWTHGKPGSYLIVQDDGNVVIYSPTATWNSGTSQTSAPPSSTTPPTTQPQPTIINVCSGSTIPYGYILVNFYEDFVRCGSSPTVFAPPNMWVLAKYIDMPIGSILNVCSTAPTPVGWVVTSIQSSLSSCYDPLSTNRSNNVKTIRRAS